ncbi:MAG: RNA methyltransferase [Rhodothermaceae bacterium]|nr:RNA methyltransferase [Rhodothermaceae bacterium]
MVLASDRFPHAAVLEVDGHVYPADMVRAVLAPFLSERRRQRIAEVAARRTYTIVPVLEGLSDAGNLHAVLRSAEGLGYGAAEIVAPEGEAVPVVAAYARGREPAADALGKRAGVRAAQGSHKWIDLRAWSDADAFVAAAHDRGYAVVATHLSADAIPITAWDFTQPTALVFGNERDGVSEALLARADANVLLPIDGFIQSYNISVAAALALYHARQDRLARQGHHGDLAEAEQAILTALFYIRSVAASSQILAREAAAER